MNELDQLKKRIADLEYIVRFFVKQDRYLFQRDIEMFTGKKIKLGNVDLSYSEGLKIGSATTQKIALYGETPVVQASAISAPSAPGAIYSQSEAASAVTAINSIRTALTNIGVTA